MKQLLWTIQHEAAWEVFEKTGVLVANEDYLFCQDDLRFAYDWISQQMIQKNRRSARQRSLSRVGMVPVGGETQATGFTASRLCGTRHTDGANHF